MFIVHLFNYVIKKNPNFNVFFPRKRTKNPEKQSWFKKKKNPYMRAFV